MISPVQLEQFLERHRALIVERGALRVYQESEDLRDKRPFDETKVLCEKVYELNLAALVRRDLGPRDRFVDFVTSYRSALDFQVSTLLRGFLSFRRGLQDALELERLADADALGLLSAVDELYAETSFQVADLYLGKLRELILGRERVEQAHRELLDRDQAKTQFFQDVAHELRTPLALVLGPLESALLDEARDGGTLRAHVEVAVRAARKLLGLTNQLLDVLKLDAGRMPLQRRRADLAAFLRTVGGAFESLAERRGLRLRINVGSTPVNCAFDSEKVEQIVSNLLSNAIKFTGEAGVVALGLSVDGGEALIEVSDTGVGMSPDELGTVFERFRQGRHAGSGSGIGLSLARDLAELHGGALAVRSTVGEGSVFTLRLPLTSAEDAPVQGKVTPLASPGAAWEVQPPPEPPPELSPARALGDTGRCTVLVIEDNADMRAYIRYVLSPVANVEDAADGREGLALARRVRPDLVVSDVMMPHLDGLGVLRALREEPATRSTPVLLLTARAGDEARLDAITRGATDYLSKPFSPAELRARVHNLLLLKLREREVEALSRYISEDVLKRYVDPTLADALIAGAARPGDAPELRYVTVLVCDLVDSTRVTEEIGAVRMAEVLQGFLDAMGRVAYAEGGSVDKLTGDGVMVLFGAPVEAPPEVQARQAARCARALLRALDALNEAWGASGPHLEARIGVSGGEAVVGQFGGVGRLTYTAIGTCVNRAARLQTLARPGEVLLAQEVASLLGPDATSEGRTVGIRGLRDPCVARPLAADL